MARDYENKALWNKPMADGVSVRDHLRRWGGPTFDVDAYIDSYLGERKMQNYHTTLNYETDVMNPGLLEYWRNYKKGLIKEMHNADNPAFEWSSYVPVSAMKSNGSGRLYPMIFELHGGMRCGIGMENTGFIQLAAEQEIIIVCPEKEGTNYIEEIYHYMLDHYPVDPSRVYCSGFSYGGAMTYQNLIINTRIFAAGNLGGTAHGGPDMTVADVLHVLPGVDKVSNMLDHYEQLPEYAEKNAQYGIAMVYSAGMAEARYPFPLCEDPFGPQGGTLGKHKISGLNQLCRMAGIKEFDFEQLRQDIADSTNECEKAIGVKLDNTWTIDIEGVRHFCGELYDANHVPVLRFLGTENNPHDVSPTAPELVWKFFCMFRRDPETGKLIYVPRERIVK